AMRTIAKSLGALAAVAVIAAAGAAAAQTLSKEPIKLAVGVDPAFSAIYYAKQAKLFEKAGLNVELMQFTQGGDAVDALIAAQVHLAASAESTIMIRSTRGDVRALAVFSQSGTFIKFVARSGITDVKQAKKFGVVVGSVSEFSTIKLLAKYGIDEKSVEFVKAGPPEFPALLARGSVDGYFLWEPWPANGVKQGGKVLATSGDVGYVYNMLIAAAGPWFDKNKAEATALLKALAESCNALTADPAKAGAATQAEVKLPAAQANELLKGVEWGVRDFTDADLARYKEIAAFQAERKITAKAANVDTFALKGFYKP
ncbi:MAG: ABC transporter substrate-binding protein, partial [Alphaproteobacteria bacterium]